MLSINIKSADLPGLLPPALRDSKRSSLVAAESIRDDVQRHLMALPGESYYKQAAESVQAKPTESGAVVGVYQRGMALRYYGSSGLPGGVVRSKKVGGLLAIPAHKALSGTYPSELPGLIFRRVKKDWPHLRGLLVKKDTGALMYRLVDETKHQADPSILPSDERMQQAGMAALMKYIKEKR